MTYDLRPAGSRFRTQGEGRDTWHCFSFATHYDPTNTSFGTLVACNDDTLQPGAGYDMHEHRDVEIVSWVLDGELAHTDSTGHAAVLRPGVLQRLSAGSGVEHSERNESAEPTRFVQMWLQPDLVGVEPGYAPCDVGDVLVAGGLAPVLEVGTAVLHVGRLAPGRAAVLPEAPYVHLYVARGSLGVESLGPMHPGDALRATSTEGTVLTAGDGGCELLVWAMDPRG